MNIDWDRISSVVQTDEGKRELANLRNTMVELERAAGSVDKGATPDWAKWKQQLDPKIVDGFQKVYASMKVPAYEDKELENVKQRFKVIVQQAEALSASSVKRAEEIKKELKELEKEQERLMTTTVDEELANNPELGKEIDSTNEKNSFLVSS